MRLTEVSFITKNRRRNSFCLPGNLADMIFKSITYKNENKRESLFSDEHMNVVL